MRWAATGLALVACGYPQPSRHDDATISGELDSGDSDATRQIDANTNGWPTDGGIGPKTCTTAFDEDGDGKADDCDVCPLDADPAQADQDKDGIGDICDPHPMFAVERLAYASGFNGALVDEGVKISTSGTWSTAGSLLKQTATTQGRTMFLIAGGPWRRPTIELKIDDQRLNGTNASWYAGLYVLQSPAPTVAEPRPESQMCLSRYGSSPRFRLVRIRGPAGTEVAAAEMAQTVGDSVTIFCSTAHLGEIPELAATGTNTPPNQLTSRITIQEDVSDVEMSKVSVWTYYGQADFSGIAIYETTFP